MCLSTGVVRDAAVAGAPYVQNVIQSVFGTAGPLFITVALVLFGFTTLIGNLFYVYNAVIFLNHDEKPSDRTMYVLMLFFTTVIFIGAVIPMGAAWAMADICMGGMTIINLPVCMLLGKIAVDCMKDYEKQRKDGKNPVFKASSIGLDEEELEFWK